MRPYLREESPAARDAMAANLTTRYVRDGTANLPGHRIVTSFVKIGMGMLRWDDGPTRAWMT